MADNRTFTSDEIKKSQSTEAAKNNTQEDQKKSMESDKGKGKTKSPEQQKKEKMRRARKERKRKRRKVRRLILGYLFIIFAIVVVIGGYTLYEKYGKQLLQYRKDASIL